MMCDLFLGNVLQKLNKTVPIYDFDCFRIKLQWRTLKADHDAD